MSTDFWGDWGDDNDDEDDDSGEMDFDDDISEEDELILEINRSSYDNFIVQNIAGFNLITITDEGLGLFSDIDTCIYDLDENGCFKIIGVDIIDERW